MSGNISAQQVMDLRKRTGVGMSKCKEALQEAEGNIEEAIHILRKKGIASAVKKGDRETNEGVIGYTENDKYAYLIEVNAETDFVIQNERFKEFMENICSEALIHEPESSGEFLGKKYSKNDSLTLDEYRTEVVHSLGENIQVKRLVRFQKLPDQSIGIYSHMGGRIVSLVVLKGASDQIDVAKEVAMHIAAEAPDFLKSDDVPEDVKIKEEEIARTQVQNKPPEIIDKIIQGKMKSFYEQTCLVNQKYVKDPSISVEDFVKSEGKKAGKDLEITGFTRWQIGE